jgi:hypothetical protein
MAAATKSKQFIELLLSPKYYKLKGMFPFESTGQKLVLNVLYGK